MPDPTMFAPPDCAACGAVSSETVAELHRAHAADRDEWQVQLTRAEARALRMEGALRTIEAWPFDFMGDCVADARALARKALEE